MKRVSWDDFHGWVMTKISQTGHDEEQLLRIAAAALTSYFETVDRWFRLEKYEGEKVVALWLKESEAKALRQALKGPQNGTVRILRQDLEKLYDPR